MREFSKVSPQLWMKKGFRSLSDDGKLTMLYLLTCRHQNSAGCYHLPDGYASSDLGWDADRYRKARMELESGKFVVFDEETSEIYILGWFDENPVTNDKHLMGCERIVGSLDSEMLQDIVDRELHESEGKMNSSRKKRRSTEDAF